MTTLTTHVLDIARGVPAAGVAVSLYVVEDGERSVIAETTTNTDGRTDAPLAFELDTGTYELVFAAGAYLARSADAAFYDDIAIRFKLDAAIGRYHVPLLLAPWGYSTYRGS